MASTLPRWRDCANGPRAFWMKNPRCWVAGATNARTPVGVVDGRNRGGMWGRGRPGRSPEAHPSQDVFVRQRSPGAPRHVTLSLLARFLPSKNLQTFFTPAFSALFTQNDPNLPLYIEGHVFSPLPAVTGRRSFTIEYAAKLAAHVPQSSTLFQRKRPLFYVLRITYYVLAERCPKMSQTVPLYFCLPIWCIFLRGPFASSRHRGRRLHLSPRATLLLHFATLLLQKATLCYTRAIP
jgi:hypothetical protein